MKLVIVTKVELRKIIHEVNLQVKLAFVLISSRAENFGAVPRPV